MKTFSSVLSLAVLSALARAGGIVDNTAEAAQIAAAASQLSGAGNYVFTNVATGQTLAFTRSDSTTDFYPQDGGDSLAVQFQDGAARLSGGNNKCASAQWSYEVEGGVDYAAVSYACAVGTGELTGTSTLEKTKQWWYLVPTGSSDDSSSGDNDDDDSDDDDDEDEDEDEDDDSKGGISISVGLQLAAKQQVASTSSSEEAAPSTTSAAAAVATAKSTKSTASTKKTATKSASSSKSSSSSKVSRKQAKYNKLGYWTSKSSSISMTGVDTSSVDSKDRTTWVCRHPGWWLNAHPAYITKAGHVECKSDLAAYRAALKSSSRMTKRSRHAELAKKLAKKGSQSYYIIAQDHIDNMATRAISSSSLGTAGGYTSTTLSLWDKTDANQQWTITAA